MIYAIMFINIKFIIILYFSINSPDLVIKLITNKNR